MRSLVQVSLRCGLVLLVGLLLCRHFQAQAQEAQLPAATPPGPSAPPLRELQQQDEPPLSPASVHARNQESFVNLRSLFNITSPMRGSFSERRCLMCRFSVSLINYALKTRRGHKQIDRIANSFCTAAHLESPLVCSKVTKLFNHEITKVLTHGIVTPNQICGLLSNNTCGHFHSPLDDWEVNLEASRHLDQAKLAALRREIEREQVAAQPAYRVVHLSDTHVDLKYAPGAAARCEEPLCCQQSSTPLNGSSATDSATKAGFWGSYGPCDLPLRTFEAILKYLNATIEAAHDIDYVLWTGDIQPHDVWAQSKQEAVHIYDTVFAKLFEHLPGVKILPTLGNHEMIPADSFSPSNLLDIARDDSPVWLYKKLDSFWARWLPADTAATITRDGFYATSIRPGLKAVSLNTNFCHSKNFWLYINSTDPGNQLQWLVHELQMSELAHERVHIIGHIPPGSDDCMKVWSKNYARILRRFSSTITGQFFGHTHNNEFEMFYERDDDALDVARAQPAKERTQAQKVQVIKSLALVNTTHLDVAMNDSASDKSTAHNVSETLSRAVMDAVTTQVTRNATLRPIGVAFVGPSMTTFVDLNPSFRIYTIEPKLDFRPTDFETYFMNLTAANMHTNQEPEWTSAGMFSKAFGLNDTLPESMHALLVDIANDFKDLDDDTDDNATTSALAAGDSNSDTNDDDDDDDEVGSDDNAGAKTNASTTNTTSASSTAPTSVAATGAGGAAGANSTQGQGGQEEVEEDEGLDGDDRLFELFWIFNSYSDAFTRAKYDQISSEDKRKFLCRLLTGEAHNSTACDEFLPMVTMFRISPSLVKST